MLYGLVARSKVTASSLEETECHHLLLTDVRIIMIMSKMASVLSANSVLKILSRVTKGKKQSPTERK